MLPILTPILLTNIFQINTGGYGRKVLETHFDCYFAVLAPPCHKQTNFSRRKCPHGCSRNLLEFWELKTTVKTTPVSKFCLHVFLCKYFPCHMPINFNKLDVLQFRLRCSWGKSDVDLKYTREQWIFQKMIGFILLLNCYIVANKANSLFYRLNY